MNHRQKKLVARAKHVEVGRRKTEITGYDALYFTQLNGDITLWLGQAKAGAEDYCKKGITDDLNDKFGIEYFADTAFYIADRSDSKDLNELLNKINNICYEAQCQKWNASIKNTKVCELLKTYNVKIRIPCLLAYSDNVIYKSEDLKSAIDQTVLKIQNYYDIQTFNVDLNLPYDIQFYIFPIKDVSYIRMKLIEFKRGII